NFHFSFLLLFPSTVKFPSSISSPFSLPFLHQISEEISQGRSLRKKEEEVQRCMLKKTRSLKHKLLCSSLRTSLVFLLILSYTNRIKRLILTEKTGQIVFTRNQKISGFLVLQGVPVALGSIFGTS
uniref:Uncharacterized protein n=1 Tax=Cucumis melo TaxID=3656 RepID=A0A9I9EGH1_CUCME